MKAFKRILVALDLSTMDEILIRYSFWFGKSVGVEKICFLFCAQELKELKEDYLQKEDGTPWDEGIRQHLSRVIEKNKSNFASEHEIIIDQIKPLPGLLYWRDVKKANLVIVGKKKRSEGSGVISRQFIRQSDCPVLFVPEESKPELKNLLIPIDFSENSHSALQLGVGFHSRFDELKIYCLNIYFVPSEYYRGLETEPDRLRREKAAMDQFRKFITPFESIEDIHPLFIADSDSKMSDIISHTAAERKAGLIIIGALGHSKLKLLTVGSTAEKMMLTDFNIPLLVIRK